MSSDEEISTLLKKIEANQQAAVALQREQLELAKAQFKRSSQSIEESIALQRSAVARQAQLTKVLLPIVGILLVLILYLLFRWDIL